MSDPGLIERALCFGDATRLVGILCEPPAEARVTGAPVAVFLNSGIIHRVGASRLYVQAARRLAAAGFTSLRFDFSGIGDSEPRRDALRFEESAVREVREALDHLTERTGASTFVLCGLCSGADVAHEAGLVDARVVGLAQLDPYAYRTPQWYLRHYGPRILQAKVWANAARVRLIRLRDRLRPPPDDGSAAVFVAPEYRRVFPPKAQVEAGVRRLAARGVRFFVCFTGDEREFLYPEQYAEAFSSVDFQGRLQVHHFTASDHTFTQLAAQATLFRELVGWYGAAWGAGRAGAGDPA